MSINNVQLNSIVVGEWYKDALIASPDAPPATERPTQTPMPASLPIAASAPAPSTMTAAAPTLPSVTPASPAPSAPAASTMTAAAPAPPSATPPPTGPAAYKFLGNNRKQIAIVVHSPGIPFLPDNQLQFLTKILEACRMNIGDIAIVNAASAPVVITALRQQLSPTVVLLFGLEPVAIKLPINFPVFRLQPYDACTYLSAPALSLLVQNSEESKLLKSKLWICLKTLFNV
jgi:hypothetical protein